MYLEGREATMICRIFGPDEIVALKRTRFKQSSIGTSIAEVITELHL